MSSIFAKLMRSVDREFCLWYNKNMDKVIQDIRNFVTDEKNRTTVIAATAGIVAVVAGIVFTAKRGKAKRK